MTRRKRGKKSAKINGSKADAKIVKALKATADFLSQGKTFVVNVVLILSFLILVPILVYESISQNVIIEPITWPKALNDMGYSGDVGAYRLWDAFEQIGAEAGTKKERPHLLASAQQFEFTIPEQGGSIKSVFISIKKFLHLYDTRIAGEFVCQDDPCKRDKLTLRIRIFQKQVTFLQFENMGSKNENEYFRDAALQIMKVIDPYVAASYLFGRKRSDSMEIAHQMIQTKHPDAKWAANLIGLDRKAHSNYKAAIEWYSKAIAYDKTFMAPYINAGVAFEAANNLVEAKRYYTDALQHNPKYARAYVRLGELAGRTGDDEEAEKNFALAFKIEPNDSYLYDNIGTYYRDKGKKDKAREYFENAIHLDPNRASAHYSLAKIRAENNDIDGAEKLFQKAIRLRPATVEYHLALGDLCLKSERFDGALDAYVAAANLDATNSRFLYQLAKAAEQANRADIAAKALQIYLKAEKNGNNLADAKSLLQRLTVGSTEKK
jgi:tetratricopeptide (TPR) repeat protein